MFLSLDVLLHCLAMNLGPLTITGMGEKNLGVVLVDFLVSPVERHGINKSHCGEIGWKLRGNSEESSNALCLILLILSVDDGLYITVPR